MTKQTRQPAPNGRHRDANGQISRKHGNTQVGTLREIYGEGFAGDTRSDAKLGTVLTKSDVPSLHKFLEKK